MHTVLIRMNDKQIIMQKIQIFMALMAQRKKNNISSDVFISIRPTSNAMKNARKEPFVPGAGCNCDLNAVILGQHK